MSHRRRRRTAAYGVPAVEGVQFTVGTAKACAVRTESRDIAVRVSQHGRLAERMLGFIPFVRGMLRFVGAIARLWDALNGSGELEPQKSLHGRGISRSLARLFRTTPQAMAALGTTILMPLITLLALVVLPQLSGLAMTAAGQPRAIANGVACAVRILGLFLGTFLIGRLKLIDRLCMYRGASAKVANAYRVNGAELTHEQAVLSPRITPESDGAFLLLSLAVSFIVFAVIAPGSLLYGPAGRVIALLVTAGAVNELVRPLERAKPDSLVFALGRPYRALEHLFTIEPHNQMIEVAICALQAAQQNDLSEEEP